MGSLTTCLKKIGLEKHEAAILRGAAKEYRDEEDMKPQQAAQAALLDYIRDLKKERSDLVAQIEKAGGEVPAAPSEPGLAAPVNAALTPPEEPKPTKMAEAMAKAQEEKKAEVTPEPAPEPATKEEANKKVEQDVKEAEQTVNEDEDLYDPDVADLSQSFAPSEDDLPPMLRLKSSPKVTSENLQALVSRITSRWKNGPRVVIAPTYDALPEATKKSLERTLGELAREASGVLHNGTIYLVQDGLSSLEEAEITLFHEGNGHEAFRRLYKGETYAAFNKLWHRLGALDGLRKIAKDNGFGAEFEDYVVSYKDAEGLREEDRRYLLTEELMAWLAERNKPSLGRYFREVLGAVRNWLRKMGLTQLAQYNDADLAYLMRRARRALETAPTDVPNIAAARLPFGWKSNEDVTKGLGGITVNLSKPSSGQRASGAKLAAEPTLLKTMTLRQIVDVFEGKLKGLRNYASRVHTMDSVVNRLTQAADELDVRWNKLPQAQLDKLAEVQLLGTVNKMFPDKELSEQTYLFVDEDGKPLQGAALQAVHQQYNSLKEKYKALDPATKAIYHEARTMLEAHWKAVQALLIKNIEDGVPAGKDRDKAIKAVKAQLLKSQGPYFPLKRFGKWVVVAKRGDEREVPTFNSAAEAIAAAEDYRKQGWEATHKLRDEFDAALDGVPGNFIEKIKDLIQHHMSPEDAADLLNGVNQLYLSSLPELSGAKQFLKRRGVPGWSKDTRRAFASSMFHGAFYQAKLESLPELRRQLATMRTDAAERGGETDILYKHMRLLHKNAMQRWDMPLIDFLGNANYVFYLGFTPSFFVLNMLQNPLVALPMIGAKFGFGKASAAMLKASKQVAGKRLKQNFDKGWTTDLDLKKVTDDAGEQAMLQALMDEGLIDLTQSHDLGTVAGGRSPGAQKFMKWATFLPHHTEVFNRVTAALAAYRLAKADTKLGVDPVKYAKEVVANTHFDYSNSNKPYFMTPGFSKMGKLIFALKQYQQHMIYSLVRNAYLASKGSKEEKRVARRQLAALFTLHGAAAGAMGLPFAAIPFAAANVLNKIFGDDDEPWESETAFRNALADAFGVETGELMSRGLGRAVLPGDISQRVGLSDLGLLWRWSDASEGKAAWNEMVAGLMGPAFAIPGGVFDAAKHFSQGNYAKGWEATSPKVLRDLVRTYRYASEGEVTSKGRTLRSAEAFTGADLAAQALGFKPSRMSELQEGRGAQLSTQKAITDRKNALLRAAVEARASNNKAALDDVMRQIKEFNRKQPEQAITVSAIIRAVVARERGDILTDERGISTDPKNKAAAQAARFASVE